jgi:hypothetical protein
MAGESALDSGVRASRVRQVHELVVDIESRRLAVQHHGCPSALGDTARHCFSEPR